MKAFNTYIRESKAEDFLDELSDVVTDSKVNPFPKYKYSRAGWSYVPFGEKKYPAIMWEHDSDDKAVLVMVCDIETREIRIMYVENFDPAYRHFSVKDEIVWNVPQKGWTRTYLNKCGLILRDNN